MYELIYSSFANSSITSTDIEDILKTARDFNSENNITGCLLYHNKQFIQILEGDERLVEDLYKSIQEDKRHGLLKLWSVGNKKERMFDGWSMAYRSLDPNNVNDASNFLFANNIKAFSELTEKPTPAVEIFWREAKKLVEENE